MENYLVTIGIPTYNRSSSLNAAISSVLSQSYQNIEVIVCDNCSTDDTQEVCKRWALKDNRIKLHRQETNVGAVSNFNTIPALANGTFFMWLADDDRISSNFVTECISILSSSPETTIVSGQAVFICSDGTQRPTRTFKNKSSSRWSNVLRYLFFVTDNSIFYGLMRTNDIRQIKLKNVLAGDWLLVMRLAYLGKLQITCAAQLFRSINGASSDSDQLLRAYGFSRIERLFPILLISREVYYEIVRDDNFWPFSKFSCRWLSGILAACITLAGKVIFWRVIPLISRCLQIIARKKADFIKRIVRALLNSK